MPILTHAEALVEAIRECMDEDDNVALIWGSLMGVGGNNHHVQKIKTKFDNTHENLPRRNEIF